MLRRGPSAWSHLGRWDHALGVYEPGAWIRGNLYPQRCDLSPDGRWFCYLTLKAAAKWKAGQTYVAISRLPWLTALAAWGTCGTWTRGLHFVEDTSAWPLEAPDEGDAGPCRRRFGVAVTTPAAFAVERRRGWTESPDSPPRAPGDVWDEARAGELTMRKSRPQSEDTWLTVQGRFAAFRGSRPEPICYEIIRSGRPRPLDDVQWADWSADGRLLVATTDGKLQVRDESADRLDVVFEVNLNGYEPAPSPPPAEAHHW